jgi:diacylglycerol kinase family enzyme
MRGLLVVNPKASSTSPRAREVLIDSLAHQFHLKTITTDHRGHAAELGATARRERVDAVIVFGGDGTVNEVVNGMLGQAGAGPDVPALGIIPGGSANVLSRTLGYPQDAIEATGELISNLRHSITRTIGLGRANDRWFLCNAGLGVDAEIIEAMEQARADGKTATPTRYFAITLAQILRHTDRKTASLVVIRDGEEPVRGVFLAIVQNTSPWTYLGALPVSASPDASFETGLDLWAVRSMSIAAALRYSRRILMNSRAGSTKNLLVRHDESEFRIACQHPTSFQVDGEGLGLVDEVHFSSHPHALQVFAHPTS